MGVLLSFFVLGGGGPVAGQTIIPLIQFNKEWRYEASGLDLGSAWRTNDYDDSAWDAGARRPRPRLYVLSVLLIFRFILGNFVTNFLENLVEVR